MKMILMLVSVALFAGFICRSVFRSIKHRQIIDGTFLLLLFASIFFAKLAVSVHPNRIFESIPDSIIHTLQTFSLDEDYDSFIGSDLSFIKNTDISIITKLYFYLLSVLAPVCGGAFILDIIVDLFPHLRFRGIKMFSRKLYIFSELNNESIAIGKSIKADKSIKNAKLIYTDVYPDLFSEINSELIAEAKSIGGICLKDDISGLWPSGHKDLFSSLKKWQKKTFFIIDKQNDNINEMTKLFGSGRARRIGKSEIYVFSDETSASDLYRQACIDIERLNKEIKIHRINASRMAVFDILERYPLFTPLMPNRDKKELELTLTILGSDDFAVNMFINSYWCGQMKDVKLNINVVAKESESEFRDKINRINPDIFESGIAGSDLLRINKKDKEENDYAEPYFEFSYVSADLQTEPFERLNVFSNTDYFFISLGSDKDNLNAMHNICRSQYIADNTKNIEMVYVISNPDITDAVNSINSAEENPDYKCNITKHAVNITSTVYNIDKLCSKDELAELYGKTYNNMSNEELTPYKISYVSYCNKSDEARALHFQYKIFSAYRFYKNSQWKYKDNSGIDVNSETIEGMTELYFDVLEFECRKININPEDNEETKSEKLLDIKKDKNTDIKDDNTLHAELRWLEHRRWNANLRSRGYSYRTFSEENKDTNGNKITKNLIWKAHESIVECYNDAVTEMSGKDNGDNLSDDVIMYDDPIIFDLVYSENNNKIKSNFLSRLDKINSQHTKS